MCCTVFRAQVVQLECRVPLKYQGTNIEVQDKQTKAIWVWFFSSFILLRVSYSDAAIGYIDSASCD